MRRNVHFSVRPRYSAGSPAQVGKDTAERVAMDERLAHERCLLGIYGSEQQKRARVLGLRGIVEEVKETRKGWAVRDMITGEEYIRPFDERMRKDGFARWGQLSAGVHRLVAKTQPVEAAEAAKDDRTVWFHVQRCQRNWGFDNVEPEGLIWEPRILEPLRES